MTATVKISELTSSLNISAGDLFLTVAGGPENYSTRKVTAQQLIAYITSSISNLSVHSINADMVTGKLNGFISSVSTVSSNTTVSASQHIILADASSGNITLTLPDATLNINSHFAIKKIDSSINNVVVTTSAGQTIDGVLTKAITTQYEAITFVNNGQNWFIF